MKLLRNYLKSALTTDDTVIRLEDSVNCGLEILTLFGYHSPIRTLTKRLFYIGQHLLLFMATILQLYTILNSSDDFEKCVEALFFFTSITMSLSKNYLATCQREAIAKMENHLKNPLLQPRNKRQAVMLRRMVKIIIIFQHLLVLSLICFLTIWVYISLRNRILLIDLWLPFDYKTDMMLYMLVLTTQTLFILHLMIITSSTDVVAWAFNALIGIECELISDTLTDLYNISTSNLLKKDLFPRNILREMESTLTSCIQQHQQVLELAAEFQRTYHTVIEIFFSVSVVIVCAAFLELTKERDVYRLVFLGIYLFFTMGEVFVYCLFGQYVASASEAMFFAAVQSPWVFASVKLKKDLQITLLRLQRPIVFVIWKLFPVSYTTFVQIMQSSWTYYTLIHTVKN